jgi:hypothetical protein
VEEKRYEKQIHKDGIRRTILTNTGNDTAKYFTKEELRKDMFVLEKEGECKFLNKLEKKGFSYDRKKNPDHSYSSHEGVIGQSSHDVVYSLPENFYSEEIIQSPSHQPFSSPPIEAKWFTTKNNTKSTARSRAVLSEKSSFFNNKENKGRNGDPKTQTTNFVGEELPGKLHARDHCQHSISSTLFEKTLSKVKLLRTSGRKEQAVSLLMDLLDNRSGTLDKADSLKLHEQMASITNELGWLAN